MYNMERYTNYIIIFKHDSPLNILKQLKPSILVKGSDYSIDNIIGREYCKEVKLFNFIENKSTSLIVDKIKTGNKI